jgi:hypothetical protein
MFGHGFERNFLGLAADSIIHANVSCLNFGQAGQRGQNLATGRECLLPCCNQAATHYEITLAKTMWAVQFKKSMPGIALARQHARAHNRNALLPGRFRDRESNFAFVILPTVQLGSP